jgi:hypothetical protein
MLDLLGPAVSDLPHVRVDGAALQRGEGELAGDADESACGQRDHHKQAQNAEQDVHSCRPGRRRI